ncbi:MAG: hypothetical protein M1482_10125, partial [Chloroflexi bacterium]|nr:hypothetical protein [Chloroflexota bacterium]
FAADGSAGVPAGNSSANPGYTARGQAICAFARNSKTDNNARSAGAVNRIAAAGTSGRSANVEATVTVSSSAATCDDYAGEPKATHTARASACADNTAADGAESTVISKACGPTDIRAAAGRAAAHIETLLAAGCSETGRAVAETTTAASAKHAEVVRATAAA